MACVCRGLSVDRGQKTAFRNWFSPSKNHTQPFRLVQQGSTYPRWAISPAPRVERKLSFPEDWLMCLATLLPRIFWYTHRPTSFLPLSIKDRLWPRYYSQTHRTGSEKKEVRGKKGRGKRALMTQNCIACMLLSPSLALPKQESEHGPPRAVGLKSLPHCKPRLWLPLIGHLL